MPTDGGKITTKFGALNTLVEQPADWENMSGDEKEVWLKENGIHAAVDVGSPDSDEIYAVYAGTVVYVHTGDDNGGNVIILESHYNGETYYSVYFHLKDDPSDLIDIYYQKGEVIGQMGSSGIGSKHLHFEIRTVNGVNAEYGPKGYWAKSADELDLKFVDISSIFGGYDEFFPATWK